MILSEISRVARYGNHANKLRALYDQRYEARKHLNAAIVDANPDDEEIADFEAAIKAIDAEIEKLEAADPLSESQSEKQDLVKVLSADLQAEQTKWEEAKHALQLMKSTARTEAEYDAAEDYAKEVAALERRVTRMSNKIKLMKAAAVVEHLIIENDASSDPIEFTDALLAQLDEADQRWLQDARRDEREWRKDSSYAPDKRSFGPSTPTRTWFYLVGYGDRKIAGPFPTEEKAKQYKMDHVGEVPDSAKVLEM